MVAQLVKTKKLKLLCYFQKKKKKLKKATDVLEKKVVRNMRISNQMWANSRIKLFDNKVSNTFIAVERSRFKTPMDIGSTFEFDRLRVSLFCFTICAYEC